MICRSHSLRDTFLTALGAVDAGAGHLASLNDCVSLFETTLREDDDAAFVSKTSERGPSACNFVYLK